MIPLYFFIVLSEGKKKKLQNVLFITNVFFFIFNFKIGNL